MKMKMLGSASDLEAIPNNTHFVMNMIMAQNTRRTAKMEKKFENSTAVISNVGRATISLVTYI